MSLGASIICFLLAGGMFVALFWPWDKTKKKSTESQQVQRLKTYISNLQLENEELRELLYCLNPGAVSTAVKIKS